MADRYWFNLGAKIVADGHHDAVPIDGEIELGKMIAPNVGLFGKGLVGVGGDRAFEWGAAIGVRFNF